MWDAADGGGHEDRVEVEEWQQAWLGSELGSGCRVGLQGWGQVAERQQADKRRVRLGKVLGYDTLGVGEEGLGACRLVRLAEEDLPCRSTGGRETCRPEWFRPRVGGPGRSQRGKGRGTRAFARYRCCALALCGSSASMALEVDVHWCRCCACA